MSGHSIRCQKPALSKHISWHITGLRLRQAKGDSGARYMEVEMRAFEREVAFPVLERSLKPRSVGCTVVQDNGLGLNGVKDLIETASQYIDSIQFPFGTCALYEEDVLRAKIDKFAAAGIEAITGGAFLVVALWQHRLVEFLHRASELGFSAVELFDWTGQMQGEERTSAISVSLDQGFRVITDVVHSAASNGPDCPTTQESILKDLADGASKVLVPMHDCRGDQVEALLAQGGVDPDSIIWEPPRGGGQPAYIESLILRLGPNVNMALREPSDILTAEAMRLGLKDKTMVAAFKRKPNWESSCFPDST